MSARNSVAWPSCGPPSTFAMMMTKPAPSAPVISHLRPLITHSLPSSRAVVCSMPGSEPAPPGSVMAKQERILPSASGFRKCARWSGRATTSSRWMLPSSGEAQWIAVGPRME